MNVDFSTAEADDYSLRRKFRGIPSVELVRAMLCYGIIKGATARAGPMPESLGFYPGGPMALHDLTLKGLSFIFAVQINTLQ